MATDPDTSPEPDDVCDTCAHPRAVHPVTLPGGSMCPFRGQPDGRPWRRVDIDAARARRQQVRQRLQQQVREGVAELDAGAVTGGAEAFARQPTASGRAPVRGHASRDGARLADAPEPDTGAPPADALPPVVSDPDVRGGEPVVRGTRVPVAVLADLTAAGASLTELLEDYPSLTPELLRAALRYAAANPRPPTRRASHGRERP